jgi:hypothetical protein
MAPFFFPPEFNLITMPDELSVEPSTPLKHRRAVDSARDRLVSHTCTGFRVIRLAALLLTLLVASGQFRHNAIAQQMDANDNAGWMKELLSDPGFTSRYNALSDDGHEFFRNLTQLLPHLLWRQPGTTETPKILKRRENIGLVILNQDILPASAQSAVRSEIERTSAFISKHSGPETITSKSLPNSNYWIAFTNRHPTIEQQLHRLISAKFFGDDAAKTDGWLQTQGHEACIEFLGIDDTHTIRQGVTLIDASATLEQQLACLRRGYYFQVGIAYDISADDFRDQLTESSVAQTVYDGRLVELLYDPALTAGMPGPVAYPRLVKHVLATAETYVP